jgi:hypothetical protein
LNRRPTTADEERVFGQLIANMTAKLAAANAAGTLVADEKVRRAVIGNRPSPPVPLRSSTLLLQANLPTQAGWRGGILAKDSASTSQ